MVISREFKVGLFMVSGIAILYLGFNYLKGIDFFTSNDKYYAVYQNVDGLNVSNPIMVNGFTVGRVSRIQLLQQDANKVMVEFDIEGDIVIGDSAVAILNSDFLGNKSITLSLGDINHPIMPGDTLIAVLAKGIADILAESAQPVANNLEATIKKINIILENLAGNNEKINQMITELAKSPKILNASMNNITLKMLEISDTYNQIGLEMGVTLKSTKPAINNLTQFTDSLKSLQLNKTLTEANKALSNLSVAIEHFSNKEGTLGKLVSNDSLYVNLNNAVESLDRLIIHIDTNPKHFFSPLGKSKEKIEKERLKASKKGN